MAALVVVLPTPPLPEVTTMILDKVFHPKSKKGSNKALLIGLPVALCNAQNSAKYPLKASDVQQFTGEADMDSLSPQRFTT